MKDTIFGVSRTVAGYTINDMTKAFMTVIFPFKDNFLLDQCFRIVSIAFSFGLKFCSSETTSSFVIVKPSNLIVSLENVKPCIFVSSISLVPIL